MKFFLTTLGLLAALARLPAATTIDAANRYAYAANVGWLDLGNGAPANQIQYQNNSAADFGVNQDGLGNLRGYAYGANIGWISFENTGAAKVDLLTGRFTGSAWSANCGWISLSNALAYVQTDTIQKGALAPDGLPVAWLLQNFGTTNVMANADPDNDGQSNLQEYLAGTAPNNTSSCLRITAFAFAREGVFIRGGSTDKSARSRIGFVVAALLKKSFAGGIDNLLTIRDNRPRGAQQHARLRNVRGEFAIRFTLNRHRQRDVKQIAHGGGFGFGFPMCFAIAR